MPLNYPKLHIVKKALKTVVFLILALACANGAQAQRRKIIYLQTYDWAPYHFGLLVGANFMDYQLIMKENYQNIIYQDSLCLNLQGISVNGLQDYQITSVARDTTNKFLPSIPRPGFTVGVLGDLRLGERLNFRGGISYSLSEININYTMQINYDNDTIQRVTMSHNPHVNCLEFPLHIKYRSKRYNNVGAYLIGGINPKLYFSFSKAPVDWIKTSPFDLALELGTGFDIYNQWFKMGIEVKMGFGLLNVLKEDQVYYYGHPLEKLKNKQLQVSLTFE